LWLVDWLTRFGEHSPLSYFWLPGPALWWVVGFYAALAAYVFIPQLRPLRRWCVSIVAAWIAVGFATAEHSPFNRHEPAITCTFVAVGHGTSAVVELPDGRVLLYDAGTMGPPHRAARAISAVLWSRGISHLDAVVLSHADLDHYNALPQLFERFHVGVVYVSPTMFHNDVAGLAALRQAIEASGTRLEVIHGGQDLDVGPLAKCEILHPPALGAIGSDNAKSVTVCLSIDGQRLLLPGDLESPGLEEVLAEDPLDCSVVMAPHHGSVRSNPFGFAGWTTPEFVVISGSRARDATDVIDAYRSYGAEVLHTGHDGAVRVKLSANGVVVDHWQGNEWRRRFARQATK
jgi:competence protein ComEC